MAASCRLILDVLRVNNELYSELEAKSQFSWHCPSCLFSELPSVDVVELDTPTSQSYFSSFESIPLTVDVSGLCIVHHNVQGIHSKMDDLISWFNVCSGKNVVLYFTEIWMIPTSPLLTVPGYQIFTSPIYKQCAGKKSSSYLPGLSIFVPNNLLVERTPPLKTTVNY